MKLWVDDIRPAPDDGWLWVKTAQAAIIALTNSRVEQMSLDHDLGGDDTTREIVMWLCDPKNDDKWPGQVQIHTSNPPGGDWLMGMAQRYSPSTTRVTRHNPKPK